MAVRVKLISRGMQQLLNDDGVERFLVGRMEQVESAAKSSAPVETGEYRDSIHLEVDHTDRVVVRVIADAPHALGVEASTGNLTRALGAAG